MKNLPIVFVALVLCLSISSVLAQDDESSDLFNLSLEELLSIPVTSASKKAEGLQDAPSVIATITAEEIEDFGANNLYEVLERATGFYGISSYIFPQNSIALRMDIPSHINPNILFLINGRPFRESVKGGQNVGLLTTFPVNTIQQIEIIRGPGSVLYGSNAYIGVVNIITKDYEGIEVFGGMGSFETTQFGARAGFNSRGFKLSSGIQVFKQGGWQFADSTRTREVVVDGDSVLAAQYAEQKFGDEVFSANLSASYKSFKFSSFYGTNSMGRISSGFSVPGNYDTERLFIDLGWKDTLVSDLYTLSANVTYNFIDDVFLSEVEQELLGHDYVLELTNFFQVSSTFDFLVGGTWYRLTGRQRSGEAESIDDYEKNWINGYTQMNYQAADWLKFVAGAQVNKIPNVDLNFVPRISAVAKWQNGPGAKLMYGQAFRAAYPGETDLVLTTVVGDPNLVPETISTFEAQLSHANKKGNLTATYFRSNSQDRISRVLNTAEGATSDLIYANTGELSSAGVEVEGKHFFVGQSYVLGSFTYSNNEDEEGEKNSERIPTTALKLGVSFGEWKDVNISLFNSWYSSPLSTEGARESVGELSAYSWLTAKVRWEISHTFGSALDYGLSVEGVNLLDKKVYDPEILFGNFNAVNLRPGIGIYVNGYVRF